MTHTRKSSGFTFIGLLMIIAIAGVALAGVGIVWHQHAQREREKELLFVGKQYREAIASYYENSPNTKQYPKTLEELLLDKRYPVTKRHLRKLYNDPMTQKPDWGLVKSGQRIIGVYSLSAKEPIKKTSFAATDTSFTKAKTYQDWKFIYTPS